MQESLIFLLLIISFITLIFILRLLKKYKKEKKKKKIFTIMISLALWWVILELLQITLYNIFDNLSYYSIYFEAFATIGKSLLPVFIFLLGLVFIKTKIKFSKKYILLFIIPVLTIVLTLTNEYHHLIYKSYSIYTYESVFGPYAIIHQIYSYVMLGLGMIFLLYYSVKNSGFFSRQSLLIVAGTILPLIVNILETYGIVKLPVYSTPISFAFAVAFYALSILKFDFLKTIPIALQKIVDRMSDAYIVINEDNIITDFNETFLNIFNLDKFSIRNKSLFEIIKGYGNLKIDINLLKKTLDDVKDSDKTMLLEEHFPAIHKDFHIEINRITSKGNFLGILILLKDITQHNIDMQTIKDNQEMLIEKERLASLGQMIGGIAHNLKTPIMSIAGATEGLSDLIHEYDTSVGDPEVTVEDHHEIAKDMNEWIEKIRTHLSYMSDVITAIKGQAVNFSDQTSYSFSIKELINYVNILMKHELDNALINLNIQADVDTSLSLNGNINSLVQVINNIISNAIQAYQSKGKTNENINFNIYKENSNLIFKIEDQAGGLPEDVQDKLFREMVKKKKKNGTGLGLFMSYSNIKAHFNGNISYTTAKGKGTAFLVEIPYSE